MSTRRDEVDRVVRRRRRCTRWRRCRRTAGSRSSADRVALDLQAPARVREADDRRPAPCPTSGSAGPSSATPRSGVVLGIVLFLQPQQAEVAGVDRREAGDLDVVAHQVRGGRERVVACPRRTAFWCVPARAPSSARSRRRGPRPGCAASCPRASRLRSGSRSGRSRRRGRGGRPRTSPSDGGIDPARRSNAIGARGPPSGTVIVRVCGQVFRPAAARSTVYVPGGQAHGLAVAAIDLAAGRRSRARAACCAPDRRGPARRGPGTRPSPAGRPRRGRATSTSGRGSHVNRMSTSLAEAHVLRALADIEAPICASRLPASRL